MIIATVLSVLAMTGPRPQEDFGRDDRWVSGWGMGVSEAAVTHGPGNQIYVTCGEGQTGIRFMLAGDSPNGFSTVLLTFDGEDPVGVTMKDGKIDSNCRVCAANYVMVANALRRHRSVHVRFDNGTSTRFTLNGSAEAIVECEPDAWR